MARNENPWSPWLSQHVSGTFAHPDAPTGGMGYGYSREAGPSGTGIHGGKAPDPHSPDGRDVSPTEAAANYALYEAERAKEQIAEARSTDDLLRVIEEAFGAKSFSGEFCRAQLNLPESKRFLAVQKQFAQAELYDHLSGRVRWPLSTMSSLDFRGPVLWQVGHWLPYAGYKTMICADRLKKPAEQRDALLKELTAVFAQSEKVFADTRVKLGPQAGEQWVRYTEFMKTGRNRTEAGGPLGLVLAEVVTTAAALMKSGEYHAKLAGGAPQLTQFALVKYAPTGLASTEGGATAQPARIPLPRTVSSAPESANAVMAPNPARSVPAPTTEERALAAQENAQPDDGLNAERFSAREKIVRDFYEGRPGLGQMRADQDMGCHPVTREPNKHPAGYGIDLSCPVKVVEIPPPPKVEQYVKPHGNPGNFFDPKGGQSADALGLNGDPKIRQSKSFSVKETSPKQQALISRNGPVVDNWTDESNPIPTKGTGTQMTVDNTTKAGLTPQPQPW